MADPKYIGKNVLNHTLELKKGNVSGSATSTGSFGKVEVDKVGVSDGFYHSSDADEETYIKFPTGDKIDIVAGGVNFIHAWQRDSDFNKLIFNQDNTDTDIIFRSANGSNNKLLYLDASADNIGIKEGVPSASLHIAGNLWISGSSGHVTASGDISASGDVTADNLYTSQYIYHTDDSNTYLNFTSDRLRFQIGGISYIDLNDASAAPHDITFNDGGNNVDFTIKGTSNNPLFKTDASHNRIGMFGVGSPTADLHIDGNVWVSGSNNHITASGNISTDGQIKFNQTAATGETYTFNNISSTLSSDHSLGFNIASGSSALDSILKVSGSHVGGFVGINKYATDVLTKALMVEGDVSGSGTGSFGNVEISNNATIDGDLIVTENIKHKGDVNTLIRFTDNKIKLEAGGMSFVSLHDDDSAPFPAKINPNSERINLLVLDKSGQNLLKTDSDVGNVILFLVL